MVLSARLGVWASGYTVIYSDSWSRAMCLTISLAPTVTIVSVFLLDTHTHSLSNTHTHSLSHTHTDLSLLHKLRPLYKKRSVGSYICPSLEFRADPQSIALYFSCSAHTVELVNTVHNSIWHKTEVCPWMIFQTVKCNISMLVRSVCVELHFPVFPALCEGLIFSEFDEGNERRTRKEV